jgi:ribulose-5-phosphate 4-epimerase/fuculose-1-phosphate aldolase
MAYITAAWGKNEFENTETAAKYCRKIYEAGFTPMCPLLFLPLYLNDEIPEEHKDGIDMARELLRRSHVLIVCGDEVDEAVKNDIAVAQRLGITATTLDGILKIRSQGHEEPR